MLLNISTLVSCAQSISFHEPYVESFYQSKFGDTKIERISIDGQGTRVYVSYYAKTDEEISISISSSTTLITEGNKLFRIGSWELSNNNTSYPLSLNQSYSTHSVQIFTFCLIFPKIPSNSRNISIEENVNNGFYWRGIHLDKQSGDSNSSKESNENRDDTGNPYSFPREEDHFISEGSLNTDRDDNGKRPNNPFNGNESSYNNDHFVVSASGSCFALNKEGFLATCYHVIEDARRIRIRGINDDFEHPVMATVYATDKENDLAILRITDQNFSVLGNIPYQILSKPSEVGEDVFTLGYPLRAVMGDEIKLTNGVISACSGYMGDITTYQLSATVQSGNSGCPVFNREGNVIGVVNARLENIESASYAIKEHYLNQLIQKCDIQLSNSHIPSMANEPMTTKVKKVKPFVYIVEVE